MLPGSLGATYREAMLFLTVVGPTLVRIAGTGRSRPGVGISMITTTIRPGLLRATTWGAGFAALWLAVAALRPDSTFHLAPLLVAGVPPLTMAFDDSSGATSRSVSIAAAIGVGLALLATTILAVVGRLDGAALEPFGNAIAESVVAAIAGGAAGLIIGLVRVGR